MWTQSQKPCQVQGRETAPQPGAEEGQIGWRVKPEPSSVQGLALAGVKAGARPVVQEAQAGRKGGTTRWEVCWQTWSDRNQQEPVILKTVWLLSVFYVWKPREWVRSSLAFHRHRQLSRTSQHTISFSNFPH